MNDIEIKQKLKTYLLTEIIKDPDYPIQDDEPLISGGLISSFSLVNIAVFIENQFGVKIPDTDLSIETMDSINAMAARILQEKQD